MAQAGYTPISLYYSSTPAAVPTNTNLVAGELALNIADGKLYYKDGSNVVQLLASKDANGDVVGPASATADSLVAFDGTTGKLIKQITTGTGVVTALGVNTGSAGAFVVNGGALGTPASGTLTNCSGLPVGGISGLGTGVATALAINTGSAGAFTTNNASNTFTAAQTFRAASAVRSEAAATQDAVVLAGGASGSNSYAVSITPATLSANRTFTLPDANTTAVGTDATQTLTNKAILPRVSSTTSITSPLAWNSDNFDVYAATAQAADFTINADAGTPVDGEKIIFRIASDATPRVVTFTGGVSKGFKPVGVTLVTSGSDFTYTLTASKVTYFGAIYNTSSARWEIIALSQEA